MKIICIFLICVFLIGCGKDMIVNGKDRKTIGLINLVVNDSSVMEPKYGDVQYRVIWGNVVWGTLLFATVLAPVYFFGFSMFEPIGPRQETPCPQ